MMLRRFSPVLRPYRARLAVALVAATARPLLSAARIWLLKILIDTVVRGGRHSLLGPLAIAFVLIAAVRSLVVHWDEKLSGWVGTGPHLQPPPGPVAALFPWPAAWRSVDPTLR
jgi:hypothetical protein